jgi:sterol 3beta-glucosyltransferase
VLAAAAAEWDVEFATLDEGPYLLMDDVLRDLGAVARDSRADVVHSPALPAHHAAEMLGVPSVLVALQPGWVPIGVVGTTASPFGCCGECWPSNVLHRSSSLVSWAGRAWISAREVWRR